MNVLRLNEKYIVLMEKLSDLMLKQGEPFRARAYQKAQETIISISEDIVSPNDLKGKPGIGVAIIEKLNEYTSTGTLQLLEKEKNNPLNILSEVYGIGPKKAKELLDYGITTIEMLRKKQHDVLNDKQKIGLKYYNDILQRIPRNEIDEYARIFSKAFDKIKTLGSIFEIVGSYRRGLENSGDIDVIITSDFPKVFVNFIDILIKEGIILEVLSRGASKCLVVAKISSSLIARRVDFLYTSKEEYPFSILYFTGSKIFNTVMRQQALSMGFTMNEHGLYNIEGNLKSKKVNHIFKDERDIFNYLQLVYKEPNERVDGRAVVKIQNQNQNQNQNVTMKTTRPTKTLKKKECENTKTKKNVTQNQSQTQNIESSFEFGSSSIGFIHNFKKNGISVLQNASEQQLVSMINVANVLYRNHNPIMTDNEFDVMQEFIKNKYPNNQVVKTVGAPVERNKVDLPYEMASMDKIKPDTSALNNWIKNYNGPYVLSCKLDGVSGLYTIEEGKEPKLYTRGDGKIGQDVSYLIPHLKFPNTNIESLVIRGEFIMLKHIFETKYKSQFSNPRNLVAGIINQKCLDEKVKDIHFIPYEVIKPVLIPSKQMELLISLHFDCVLHCQHDTLSNEALSQLLVDWRKNYMYEMDGIVVTDDKIYERKPGNPEHSFAFKMVLSEQIAEAKVVDVIWTPSKDGYLKPRVQIEPIHLGGVKIEYATGFNGAFIRDNSIGIGAVVELIRSGDVIPHIRKVVIPATETKMPSLPYKWNNTKVDVLLENVMEDETVKEKNITGFFRGIGVDGLSSGNISRIIHTGFDSVPKIIHMKIDDFLKVDGFKTTMATKIYDGIRMKLQEANLVTLMSASNIFGRGFSEIKIESIMSSCPTILENVENDKEKSMKISSIKGMSQKTAEAFVEKIGDFVAFMKIAGLKHKLQNVCASINMNEHALFGKTVIMTGFRDNVIQDSLKKVGAKLGQSVTKNTFVVLVKDMDDTTLKVLEAKKLGIPIMKPDEFMKKYF